MIASTRPAPSPYFAARYAFASAAPKPAAIFVENSASNSDVLAAPSCVYPASSCAASSLSFMSPTFAGVVPNSLPMSLIISLSTAALWPENSSLSVAPDETDCAAGSLSVSAMSVCSDVSAETFASVTTGALSRAMPLADA